MSRRMLLAAVFLCLSAAISPLMANSGQDARQEEAAVLYDRGDFNGAFKKYLKLGKKGDWFAQYRVSYMHLKGQGTRANTVEALAWAVLAAQSGEENLSRYQEAVAALVPEDKRNKARYRADYYVRRWGVDENEERRPSNASCTGSNLKVNCDPGSSSVIWIPWNSGAYQNQDVSEVIETLNRSIVGGAS